MHEGGESVNAILLVLLALLPAMASEVHFFDNLSYRWMGASRFELINKNITYGESISKPQGTWQTLGAVYVKNSNFSEHKDCLFYYVPLEEKPGVLKIKFLRKNQRCEDFLHQEGSLLLEGIYNLGLEVREEYNSDFHLRIRIDEKKYDYKFPNFSKRDLGSDKLSNGVMKSQFHGIEVGVPVNTIVEDEVQLKDGEICFDVNDACEVTMSFRCDQCENSSYPVIASACSQKFRQVCGVNNCGTKDTPACIRGYVSTGYKLDYCINDSPIGFCAEGLRVTCFNNQLFCK